MIVFVLLVLLIIQYACKTGLFTCMRFQGIHDSLKVSSVRCMRNGGCENGGGLCEFGGFEGGL